MQLTYGALLLAVEYDNLRLNFESFIGNLSIDDSYIHSIQDIIRTFEGLFYTQLYLLHTWNEIIRYLKSMHACTAISFLLNHRIFDGCSIYFIWGMPASHSTHGSLIPVS